MTDRVFEAFVGRQRDEGLALAASSDLLDLVPVNSQGTRFVAAFGCTGLIERSPGEVGEADHFEVGIWFPSDYLRHADPFRVLTWLGPREVFHPNIAPDAPAICVGRVAPGTGLVELLYQVFEVITWNRVTMREDDALNRAACQWARAHRDRFPVDRRPLKRRTLDLHLTDISSGSSRHDRP
jgi:hypothetical protein